MARNEQGLPFQAKSKKQPAARTTRSSMKPRGNDGPLTDPILNNAKKPAHGALASFDSQDFADTARTAILNFNEVQAILETETDG
jgi:hypothetical protein